MKTIHVTIPDIPPSVNTYWKTARNKSTGRPMRYLSERAKAWKQLVNATCKKNILKGKLSMEIIVYLPDNRRRDVDNMTKGVLDSLEKVFYEDDKQIWDLKISKKIEGKPRTEIKLEQV